MTTQMSAGTKQAAGRLQEPEAGAQKAVLSRKDVTMRDWTPAAAELCL